MIEFRHLETFRAVMHMGSFTKAASKLHTSQPTVSRSIAELQAVIGFRLFVRKGGSVAPTPEAIELYSAIDRSFLGIGTILREAESIAGRRTGHLRILSMPALAWSFLPQVIARFQVERPNVKVSIDVQRSEAIAGWTSTEYFDVGFSMMPIHRQGVRTQLFHNAEGICLMPEDHPLTQKEIIRPKDLDGVNFISSGPLSFGSYQQTLDAVMREEGASYTIKAETPITAIACELVVQGVGVAIVDKFVALTSRHRGVAMRTFQPSLKFSYGVFMPHTSSPNILASEFVRQAIDAKNQLMS